MLPRLPVLATTTAATLLAFLLFSPAHGHGDDGDVAHTVPAMASHIVPNSTAKPMATGSSEPAMTYFSYHGFKGLLMAHVMLMIIAWVVVLPIGVMLSLARSRLSYPTQWTFLVINGLGLLVGTVYNKNTPDLYKGNAHHGLGWALTWMVVAQTIFGIIRLHTGVRTDSEAGASERIAFLQVSAKLMAEDDLDESRRPAMYEYPRDSGHGTEESTRCNSFSSVEGDQEKEQEPLDSVDVSRTFSADGGLKKKRGTKRVLWTLANKVPESALRVVNIAYDAVDRLILIFGFIAITTGVVTYGGIAKGHDIFNILAHFIKGAIFFWYGVLTLGRWMGCYGDIGWAWNVRPTTGRPSSLKARFPSAEFTESFVIFLYGFTNVWLEHLEGWGKAWSAADLEHVSISILFIGGGSLGMLVESAKARDLLNTTLSAYHTTHRSRKSTQDLKSPPRTYCISTNPIPGLTLLLLGLLMSSHHQASMVSTKLHSQWGTLLVGFFIARSITYILLYLSPPTSILPSRPPSELITSFCLMATGLIFMASNKNTVFAIEQFGLNAMVVFTVVVGLTTLLMAWVVAVVAVKGWAIRRTRREMGMMVDA